MNWRFQIQLTEGSIMMPLLSYIFLCKSFIPQMMVMALRLFTTYLI